VNPDTGTIKVKQRRQPMHRARRDSTEELQYYGMGASPVKRQRTSFEWKNQ